MTEQELIKIAQEDFFALENVDKSLITKNVVDNLEYWKCTSYHKVLQGVNPDCFSKEKALQLIECDAEIYALLSSELQNDKDVLQKITNHPDKLPKSLFENRNAIKYVLERYNIDGKSWAAYSEEVKYLIIKPDIKVRKYLLYPCGTNMCYSFLNIALDKPEVENANVCKEARNVAWAASSSHNPIASDKFVQHLN